MPTTYAITGEPHSTVIKGIPTREQLFDALRLGVDAGGLNSFGFRLHTRTTPDRQTIVYVTLEGVHVIKNRDCEWFIWARIDQITTEKGGPYDHGKEIEAARFLFARIDTRKRTGNAVVGPTSFFVAPELKNLV